MVVLSALVSVAGLAASQQYLVQHGLRSIAWRAREGSLKLVIAGLLFSPAREPSVAERGGQERGAGIISPGNMRDQQRKERKAGVSRGGGGGDASEPVEHEGRKRRAVEAGAGGGTEGSSRELQQRQQQPNPLTGPGDKDTTTSEMDEVRKLVCDVGALLTDERPEVSAECSPVFCLIPFGLRDIYLDQSQMIT